MKILLFSSVFILLNISLYSQTWIDSNAKWTFDYWNVSEWGTYTFTYTNDTILIGKECEAIETIKYRYWKDQNAVIHSSVIPCETHFTYSSGDSVFHFYEGSFYLLYDFSASVGDKWVIAVDENFPCDDTAIVKVIQTGTVNINNQELRTITLTTITSSAIGLTGTCVEKFGNKLNLDLDNSLGPFPGYQNCPEAVIDYDKLTFRCYVDETFETYNPTQTECDYLTEVNELIKSDFRIYPNPTSGEITIEKFDTNPIVVKLYNSNGQQIKQFDLQLSENNIDLTELCNGVYYMKVITKRNSIIKKIIKK
jgi:hypothetical protein